MYGPYGSSRYQQGSMDTTKGFTGQYNDAVTGLDYYHARYYDPVVGRFLSVDKATGNLQGMDPYCYVGGNSETKTDPTGQMPCAGAGRCGRSAAPPATSSQPSNSCTATNCSVTVNRHYYTTSDLYNVAKRRQFFADFYAQFALGYEKGELDFFDYLRRTRRLENLSDYWNFVDFRLALDQLMATFDILNHQSGQSRTIRVWIGFVENHSINRWWAAHNASIADADQQARARGREIGEVI
jgi:RHS repeat-associated protein